MGNARILYIRVDIYLNIDKYVSAHRHLTFKTTLGNGPAKKYSIMFPLYSLWSTYRSDMMSPDLIFKLNTLITSAGKLYRFPNRRMSEMISKYVHGLHIWQQHPMEIYWGSNSGIYTIRTHISIDTQLRFNEICTSLSTYRPELIYDLIGAFIY